MYWGLGYSSVVQCWLSSGCLPAPPPTNPIYCLVNSYCRICYCLLLHGTDWQTVVLFLFRFWTYWIKHLWISISVQASAETHFLTTLDFICCGKNGGWHGRCCYGLGMVCLIIVHMAEFWPSVSQHRGDMGTLSDRAWWEVLGSMGHSHQKELKELWWVRVLCGDELF